MVMDYEAAIPGSNTFGLNGFHLTGDLGAHYFSRGADEQFVAGVIAGFTYTLHLSINANISGPGGLDSYQGSMSGVFNWTFPGSAAVPEAVNTAGLMVLSLAGLAMLRGKRARD
ncbi:MAG TPA: hypothetical protein VG734_16460 [Lacunisphaera sp.]|nr:hypothetical protein [Lacunisphaera sp.]